MSILRITSSELFWYDFQRSIGKDLLLKSCIDTYQDTNQFLYIRTCTCTCGVTLYVYVHMYMYMHVVKTIKATYMCMYMHLMIGLHVWMLLINH